ncbi:hypothetical protein LIER_41339 [Lithospermum erythrorhizon]|uniref:Uncharacterized protein n=1 Tax=Lithospermum erythrorhizon TaxID=34254 RepID=A0AAV3R9C0_LITER
MWYFIVEDKEPTFQFLSQDCEVDEEKNGAKKKKKKETWVSKNFNSDLMHIRLSKNEVFPIIVEDVERIYNLPSLGYFIAKLMKEFGMGEKEEELVNYEEMKDMMSKLQDDTS